MKFEVPRDVIPLTEDMRCLIHESVTVYDGFVYFHRIPNPTDASIVYSTDYIIRLLKEVEYTCFVLDFTGRDLVNHHLRRLMLNQVSRTDIAERMTEIAIVLDGSLFRRVIIDFFVRAYLRRYDMNVNFFATKEEALVYMHDIWESTH